MARIIQISCLPDRGFGNQLFRYAFARAYAEKFHATLETPPWIGQQLFDLHDPPPSCWLPQIEDDVIPDGQVNIDLSGYFQFMPAITYYSRRKAKEWFRFKPEVLDRYPRPTGWYAAQHLRRGDYVALSHQFCVVTEESYIKAAAQYNIPENSLITVTDGPVAIRHYTSSDSFLEDFLLLMRANVILRANSTFSWWAATLSNAERVYSPVVEAKTGWCDVAFVEGNWPRCADIPRFKLTDLHLPEE